MTQVWGLLTGDMMPSMKFFLTVEMCPCIVSDLHLMAVYANFICSVKIYFICSVKIFYSLGQEHAVEPLGF